MATLNDIAKLAGVSKASVSLALSDHPRISQETKQKVRQIAEQIGYSAVKRVSASPKGRNPSFGILFFHSSVEKSGEFFKETLLGITDASFKLNYNAVLLRVPEQMNEPDGMARLLERSGVDGAVVISPSPDVYGLEEVLKSGFPLVFIGKRSVPGIDPHFVASDNHGGAKAAVNHLIGLGHRDIGIAIPPREEMFPWEEDRIDGYFSALRQAGIPVRDELIVTVSSPYAGQAPGWKQFDRARMSAVFAITPHIGLAVLQHLRQSNLSVPKDVSLVVFDNFALAHLEQPSITAVKQDMESLGRLAVQMLTEIMESPGSAPKQLLLPTQLVTGASSAKAP